MSRYLSFIARRNASDRIAKNRWHEGMGGRTVSCGPAQLAAGFVEPQPADRGSSAGMRCARRGSR